MGPVQRSDENLIKITQREKIVRRVIELLAELQQANGDTPLDGHEHRRWLKAELRRLAVLLWLDDVPDD